MCNTFQKRNTKVVASDHQSSLSSINQDVYLPQIHILRNLSADDEVCNERAPTLQQINFYEVTSHTVW